VQGKATFRGHPLHLMLVSFPIAFWSGALVTDGIGVAVRDPFWYHMSVALVAFGSLTAVPAGILGYVDYQTAPMSRAAKRVGGQHMLWSIGAIVVFPVAFALRASDWSSRIGIIATVVGSLVLLVAGYYGSELANRYRVGIAERAPGEVDGQPHA
jgi:uncharacterized membrane protein